MIMRWLKQRNAAKMEALQLIKTHGPDQAWALTFERSRNLDLTDIEKQQAMRIRRQVEKITGIKLGPDTATRYLDSPDS